MEGPSEDPIQTKEREWREALNAKFEQTNASLRERDVTIRQQREKLELLQRDFHYNLGLLLDRDAELLGYEDAIKGLKAAVNDRTATINDLKMKLDDAQLLTRRQFMDGEDLRRLYDKRMTEKDASIAEGKRQLDVALKKLEADAETHRRQMMKREGDIHRLSQELQIEHTTAICRRDAQHSSEVADLNARLQRETERSKSLESELQASQCQSIKLHTDLTDLQIRTKEVEAAYRNQIEDFRLAVQGREHIINEAKSKLCDAEKRLAGREAEMRQLRSEKDRDAAKCGGHEEEIQKTKNELREAQNKVEDFKTTIKKLNEKIKQLESDSKNEQGKSNCRTQSNGDIEIEQLKNQNQVLREVIKNMKRKVISNVASCGVGDVEANPAVDVRSVDGYTSGSQRKQQTTDVSHDCKECKKVLETQESQRVEVEEELKQLRSKVNQLSREVTANETEDEKRVQQLENTIGLLKTHMLHGLREKLQNKAGGDTKISLGDVRIMLLEQKLDRAAENIGKAVASEKRALMEEMHSVRNELVTKLDEARNKCPEGSAEKRAKLKSDEMFEKVRNEIARLESKFDRFDKGCSEGNQNKQECHCNVVNCGYNEMTLPLRRECSSRDRPVSVVRRLEAQLDTDKENNPREQHGILSASTYDSILERVLDSIPAEASNEGGVSRMRPTVKPVVIHHHPPSRQTKIVVQPKPKPLRLKRMGAKKSGKSIFIHFLK